MNANSDDATTELLELAQAASWNPALLVPPAPELFATRPLMVLLQGKHDQPLSAGIDDIRQSALEQLEHIASFSHFIEPQEGVSVLFLAEFDYDTSELWIAMSGGEIKIRAATDLREALRLEEPERSDGESDDENLRSQHLCTIIVLPESSAQHIDLESIQEAIPDFTGRAFWYDPSDDRVKVQAWEEGDLDTGYLWAIREDEDVEVYTIDAAPGRTLFATLASAAARSRQEG